MSRRITVGIPVYNGTEHVAGALRCLQEQTFRDFEVIISVDGNDQATADACRPFLADDRFHYLRWETNRGVTQGTLMLLARARGEYWGYPGADDQYEPEFLAERLAILGCDQRR